MRSALTLYSELTAKEVICLGNGARLGYVSDLQMNGCLQVTALLLPDRSFFSFSRKPCYRVAVEWIERVGEDLIFVKKYELCPDCRRKKRVSVKEENDC